MAVVSRPSVYLLYEFILCTSISVPEWPLYDASYSDFGYKKLAAWTFPFPSRENYSVDCHTLSTLNKQNIKDAYTAQR